MVPFGFYTWAIVAAALPACIIFQANSRRGIRFLLFLAFWGIYIFAMERAGLLSDPGLPPRIPVFLVIPTVILSVIFTARPGLREVQRKTSLHLPVLLQSFRIGVELLIYGAFREGVFPQRVTFEGLNFDILVGISALVVGLLAMNNKVGKPVLIAWNIAGLAILGLTVFSFLSAYYFAAPPYIQVNAGFTGFPYLLLPAVMLPVAVFLHIFSLRQLRSS